MGLETSFAQTPLPSGGDGGGLPPVTIYLNTRPAPQTITIPLTPAEAKGKKCIRRWGRDTIEQTTQIPLAPLQTIYLPVLKNKKGEPIRPLPAMRYYTDGKKITKIDSIPFEQCCGNPVPLPNGEGLGVGPLGEAGGFSVMQNYTATEGLYSSIGAVFCDKSGNLWFGTYGGGVSRYDGEKFTNFTTQQGLADDIVTAVMQDNEGRIYFGTNWGFTRLTPSPLGREEIQTPDYFTADPMLYDLLKNKAEEFRNKPTEAEKIAWELLWENKTGYHIRRQHIIGRFIVDFVNIKARTVIEVDGDIHDYQKEEDTQRTKWLEEKGFKIIRFRNEKVIADPDGFLEEVKRILQKQEPEEAISSPSGGGQEGAFFISLLPIAPGTGFRERF